MLHASGYSSLIPCMAIPNGSKYLICTAEAVGADGWDSELLPAGALLTGSEEYYPTVAINALMRSLRDAALSSQHFEVHLAS